MSGRKKRKGETLRMTIRTMMVSMGAAFVVLSARSEGESYPVPEAVPELMTASDGSAVTSRETWEKVRRPEIVRLLCEQEYGVRPVERPSDLTFAEIAAPETCFGGKAIRKRVRATYSGPYGKGTMDFSVWIPKADHPVAAFVHSSPRPAETADDPTAPRKVYLLPAEYIVSRGYAVAAYCNQDVAADWKGPDVATNGVFLAYGPKDLSKRGPSEWGILSAWAWGMSRVLDWMETEPLIDAKRVGAVGLSRNGKTALVAGAFDSRFAMTVSCCSGCSGAKLNHMANWESESIKAIMIAKKWFCPNYEQYVGHDRDGKMAFDQHFLLALVAPRLLYVSSASEDAWAGQRGEFAAAQLASPAWGLYGRNGLVEHGFPKPDTPCLAGSVGYHLRTGVHDITRYDWQCYLDFADRHDWNLR